MSAILLPPPPKTPFLKSSFYFPPPASSSGDVTRYASGGLYDKLSSRVYRGTNTNMYGGNNVSPPSPLLASGYDVSSSSRHLGLAAVAEILLPNFTGGPWGSAGTQALPRGAPGICTNLHGGTPITTAAINS
jgi:hypothetical protein